MVGCNSYSGISGSGLGCMIRPTFLWQHCPQINLTPVGIPLVFFSDCLDPASPRAMEWSSEGMLEQSADIRPSRTNSPGRQDEPTLTEAALALVNDNAKGGAAVVAPVHEEPPKVEPPTPTEDIAELQNILNELYAGPLQPEAQGSVKPPIDISSLLTTPAGSRKKFVQYNAEAEQVRATVSRSNPCGLESRNLVEVFYVCHIFACSNPI